MKDLKQKEPKMKM